jgi:predicted acylesterase/phospholipase RssA
VPLGVTVTVWDHGRFRKRLVTSHQRHRIAAVVQASCFFPGPYWQMVPLDGYATFDGAWLERVPVDDVEQLGAGKVIACATDIGGRLLKGAIRPTEVPRPKADHRVLHPIAPIALGAWDFNPDRCLDALEIGRRSAAAFAERHRAWLIG